MSNFFIPILFVIIPGVIGVKVFKTFRNIGTKQKKLKDWQDLIEIFIFSVLSYTIYGFLNNLFYWFPNPLLPITTLNAFFKERLSVQDLNYYEIGWAILISCVIGIIGAIIANNKLFFKIAKSLNITKHYGDEDVWAYFFHTQNIGWVVIRDHKLELAYFGYVELYSDEGEMRELLLRNVTIYRDENGEQLYELDKMYICRSEFELTIEVPDQRFYEIKDNKSNNKEKNDDKETNNKRNTGR